jgi:competence protein ComEC
MKSRSESRAPKWVFIIPVAGLVVLLVAWGQRPDGRLHLWVLDVGQGNAVMLRTPQGHTAVIDGGPGGIALNDGVGRHMPFWQSDVDMVVLTAPKAENVMGLVDLLGRRGVSQVVEAGGRGSGVGDQGSGIGDQEGADQLGGDTGVLGAWREAVGQSGAKVHYARRGDVIRFDGEPGVALQLVYPPGEEGFGDAPIVIRVEYEGVSVLLAGSMEKEDEGRLIGIADEGELGSDVLVVPDHGSDTALSQGLLGAVGPKVAVISVGEGNRGGDPSPEVLARLKVAGVRVYRTDVDGTVEVIVGDGELWVGSGR